MKSLSQPIGIFLIVVSLFACTQHFASKQSQAGVSTASNQAQGSTYYIDAEQGNDQASGLSPQSAWRSVKKVSQFTFQPGDRILFKANLEYNGQLELKGSGSKRYPIVVSRYGNGKKPQINGNGWKPHAVLLHNIEHWQVNDLAITNQGVTTKAHRRGVIVSAENIGDLHGLVLNNLEIFNVNGVLKKKEGGGSGILIRNGGDTIPSRFVDLHITNNHIHHTQRNGINFKAYSKRSQWYPSLGIKIQNNLIEQVPGDGIVVIGTDGALIENNTLRDFPDTLPVGDAAAGIWPWSADNTIIQFNEVSGHKAKWDGQGFDSDWNSVGTIIQYNYSHDNYGGFLLVCNNGRLLGKDINKGTINTIIRGNVSINDGIRPYPTHRGMFSPTFHITGPTENTHIYDNIIIVPSKQGNADNTLIEMDNWGGAYPNNTVFERNQIYFEGKLKVKRKKVDSLEVKNNQLSQPISGTSNKDNRILNNHTFDLQSLKRMALSTIKEHKHIDNHKALF